MATLMDRVEAKMATLETAVKQVVTPDHTIQKKMERLAELEKKESKRKEYKSKWHQEWKKNLTPEELEALRKTERERKQKERETMTDEEREAIRKVDRERKAKTNLTEEQLEARRAYNREYKRKLRQAEKEKKSGEPISEMQTALIELKKGDVVLTETKPAVLPPETPATATEKKKVKVTFKSNA
jgi:hypothetical protein